MLDTPGSADDVEVLERTIPYNGYFRIQAYRLRHRRFGGGWTEVMTRELFERGHAAVVLPYDPARDRVVLIEQFRIGAYAAGLAPWMIEAVAGIIEPGEAPEEVVRREALEEAGCAVTALEAIGTVMPSPGGSSEILHLYWAGSTARASAACTAWPTSTRTSAPSPCPWTRPWRAWPGARSSTPTRS